MIRVLVLDSQAVVRNGLKYAFGETEDVTLEAEAATGREAIRVLSRETPDLLIMDLALPDRSGLDFLQEVRRQWPELPILIYANQSEEEFAVRCLKAGSTGFVSKNDSMPDLIRAIRMIAGGGRYLGPSLAARLALQLDLNAAGQPHESLSNREYEVMHRIAQGESLKSIGHELSLSPKTISTYRERVLRKLGMRTNAELIRYVMEQRQGR